VFDNLFFLCAFVVKNAFVFAFSAAFSLTSAATAPTFATRRPYGNHLLQLRQFSGSSRANRGTKLSIQRFLPCFPPVISADGLQIVQNLQLI
jgi:hypothetical protein